MSSLDSGKAPTACNLFTISDNSLPCGTSLYVLFSLALGKSMAWSSILKNSPRVNVSLCGCTTAAGSAASTFNVGVPINIAKLIIPAVATFPFFISIPPQNFVI
ncbi:hypothetical protein D1872_204240 [compost metagenome]